MNDVHENELRIKSVDNMPSELPTTVTIANVKGGKTKNSNKYSDLRVLVDTGCSHSIIVKNYCKASKSHKKVKKYATGSGTLTTQYETKVHFSLPEFSDKKVITWNFSVTDSKDLGYDLILGRDLMTELKMDILFSQKTLNWEGISIPMRDFRRIQKLRLSKYELKAIINEVKEPIITQQATERIINILDSKYEKANLRAVIEGAKHLNTKEKELLYKLLSQYQDVFDGTLGAWKTEPVEFEMHDDAKPHNQRYYPVPHLYKKTFKKELDRLVKLGVLEKVQESEWGSPTFIIPKKDGRIRFVSDFRMLNKKLKRKPYPLPRISDTLQQLEGFNYATSLDMNMGYYHIVLSPGAADMCTIITEYENIGTRDYLWV